MGFLGLRPNLSGSMFSRHEFVLGFLGLCVQVDFFENKISRVIRVCLGFFRVLLVFFSVEQNMPASISWRNKSRVLLFLR